MPVENFGANHQIWFPSCYNQTETYQRETIKTNFNSDFGKKNHFKIVFLFGNQVEIMIIFFGNHDNLTPLEILRSSKIDHI